MIVPSLTSTAELRGPERLQDYNVKCTSIFSSGIFVKYRWHMEAGVRALQFLSGRLSVRTPRVLGHAPFPGPDATFEAWE